MGRRILLERVTASSDKAQEKKQGQAQEPA